MVDAKDIVGYILFIIVPILEISCYITLWRQRQSNILIQKRNVAIIYLSRIAAWMAILNVAIALPPNIRISFPGACGMYYIFQISVPFVSLAPQLLRWIDLWGRLERNKLMVEYGETAHLRRREVENAAHDGRLHTLEEGDESVGSFSNENGDGDDRNTNEKHDQQEEAISTKYSHHGSMDGRKSSATRQKAKAIKKKKIITLQVTVLVFMIVPIIFINEMFKLSSSSSSSTPEMVEFSLAAGEFEKCMSPKGSDAGNELNLILSAAWWLTLAIMILWFAMTAIATKSDDGLGIRREIARNITILFLTTAIILMLGYQDEEGLWQANVVAIQQLLLALSMIIMPCYFPKLAMNPLLLLTWIRERSGLKLPTYGKHIPQPTRAVRTSLLKLGLGPDMCIKHQNDATISLDAGLCILLSSSNGVNAFTDHCAKEFSVENIRFWCVVNDFHKAVDMMAATRVRVEDQCANEDEADLQAFAEDIFNTYVKVGSELQINISSSQYMAIGKKINEGGAVDRALFDNAQKEVFRVMSRHSYPRFLAAKQDAARPSLLQMAKRRLSSAVTPANGENF